jgi:hypothetical protein
VNVASLDEVLHRLRRVQTDGGLAFESPGACDWYEVQLFPPATQNEIFAAEGLLRKRLPVDFLHFWRLTNGANLFVNESALHGVGVASTHLIADLQNEEAQVYSAATLAPFVIFGRVNGAGDFLVFELATGRVLDGVHAEQPHEWRPIADSFTQWLTRFLEAGGRYYWIEALYDSVGSEK